MSIQSLTDREVQTLALLARGKPNKVIAYDLGLSSHTVKVYVSSLIRKLGVNNRMEAALVFHNIGSERSPDTKERA